MKEYKRELLQAVAGNLAVSIASGMCSTTETEPFNDDTPLTDVRCM